MITIEEFSKVDDMVYCKGSGFEYKRVGGLTYFLQTGKIDTRRILKVLIKKLEEISDV